MESTYPTEYISEMLPRDELIVLLLGISHASRPEEILKLPGDTPQKQMENLSNKCYSMQSSWNGVAHWALTRYGIPPLVVWLSALEPSAVSLAAELCGVTKDALKLFLKAMISLRSSASLKSVAHSDSLKALFKKLKSNAPEGLCDIDILRWTQEEYIDIEEDQSHAD